MLLGPGEGVLRSEYAVLLDGHGPGIIRKSTGVLYLTNHRCLFETSISRGMVHSLVRGRDTLVLLESSLPALRNVTVQRPRLGKPRILIETAHARASFDVLDPDAWFHAVAEARQALPSPYAPPVVTTTTHTIERQVVKVRCRFCGSLGDEVDGRCAACGAAL
jgi:hypothetical protein